MAQSRRLSTRGRALAAMAVALLAGLLVLSPPKAANAGPSAASAIGARYLNLHQCTYFTQVLGDSLTSVVADGSVFDAGTNVSNVPDSSLRCGPGNGGYILNPGFSGVQALGQTRLLVPGRRSPRRGTRMAGWTCSGSTPPARSFTGGRPARTA